MDTIAIQIRDIMAKYIDVTDAKADTPLTDLDIDSLDLVEAMMEIEEAFEINFTNDEIANLKCFNDIVKLVNEKKVK